MNVYNVCSPTANGVLPLVWPFNRRSGVEWCIMPSLCKLASGWHLLVAELDVREAQQSTMNAKFDASLADRRDWTEVGEGLLADPNMQLAEWAKWSP